jgi:hypothetical protein
LIIFGGAFITRAQSLTDHPFDSPLPTPVPLSPEAERALQHIATQQDISVAELYVAGEDSINFQTLGRTYRYIVLTHSPTDAVFPLLVDTVTGVVETDIEAVHQAEQAAYTARYGKLRPDLDARLQTAADDERLPVTIWVAYTEHGRKPEELAMELTQVYPEAEAALLEHGAPWAVDDAELAEAIRQAYNERLQRSVDLRVDPMVVWLEQQG